MTSEISSFLGYESSYENVEPEAKGVLGISKAMKTRLPELYTSDARSDSSVAKRKDFFGIFFFFFPDRRHVVEDIL